MPTNPQPAEQNHRKWIIGGVIALVVVYLIWNAVSGSGTISSSAEYNAALAEAQGLSLKQMQDYDAGIPIPASAKADLAKAAKIFDRLSELQASNIAPFVGAGKIYQALGQDETAVQRLVQGLEGVPKDPIPAMYDTAIEAHHLLSISYFNLKKYDSALKEETAAVTMFKGASPIYYTHRARIYLELRQYDLAQEDLYKALKVDSEYRPAKSLIKFIVLSRSSEQTELAIKKLNEKDYKGVVDEASKGLEFDPQSVQLLALRCAALISLGDKTKARADLDRIMSIAPASKDAKYLSAMLK